MTSKPAALRPDVQVTPKQALIYQKCLLQAASSGRGLLEGLIQQAASSPLLEGADNIRLNLLRQSIAQLNKHSADLVAKFPNELLKVFEAAGRPVPAKEDAAPQENLRFDQLELMDDSQVQERLEVARAQQAAALESEAALVPLTALISTVRGFSSVRPEANPLRPASYVSALQKVFVATGVLPAIRLDWLQLVGKGLGKGLLTVYADLAKSMTDAEVRPAAFSVAPAVAPAPMAGSPVAPSRAKGGAPAPAAASRDDDSVMGDDLRQEQIRLTLKKLKSLLAGELNGAWGQPEEGRAARPAGDGGRRAGLGQPDFQASGFDHTVPAALEALEDMQQVDQAMARLAQRRGTGTAPTQKWVASGGSLGRSAVQPKGGDPAHAAGAKPSHPRGAAAGAELGAGLPASKPLGATELAALDRDELHQVLRVQARGVGQVLGLEVVAIMIDNMAKDSRLLPPVQAVVRKLEMPLLRLAMIDPRFFNDKQHPARLLLETIAEHCGRFDNESNPGFGAFIQPLRQVVQELQPVPIEGPEPFALCLETLKQIWEERLEAERKQREQAQNTLRAAEQRNLMAVKVAQEIRDRPDATFVPASVLEFATGPWAQVVAQARVQAQQAAGAGGALSAAAASEAAQWMAVVVDLFWSVNPDWPRLDPHRLVKLIPGMLGRLRAGLKTIQFPQAEMDDFFEVLMALHQRALLGRTPAVAPPPPSGELLSSVMPEDAPARGDTSGAKPTSPAPKVWLAPAEAEHSGFMAEFDLPESNGPPSRLTFLTPQKQSSWDNEVLEPMPAGSNATHLTMGCWVDVSTDSNHMRAQLVWASPEGSMYMFTTTTGRNQSMTRATLDKLIEDEKLLLVPKQNVVDAALDAVAQSALNNSLKSP